VNHLEVDVQFTPLVLLSQVEDLCQACLVEEISKPDRVDRLLLRPVLVEVCEDKDQKVSVVQCSQWEILKVDNLVSP